MMIIENLQTGDVILRDSKGLIGSFFRNLSQTDKKYSHAGFIRVIDGKYWVCHYIDQENNKGLKIELLNDFIDQGKCNAFAVYHFNMNQQEKQNLSSIIYNSILYPLPFDNDFDLKSYDKLYCTEWISKSLMEAASLKIQTTKIAELEYVAPDNLYLSKNCKLVYQCNYNKVDLTTISNVKN